MLGRADSSDEIDRGERADTLNSSNGGGLQGSVPAGVGKPILSVEELSVIYKGGGIGVQGVSLQVWPSQIVTLVGPNGAGKTSTLRGIAGLLKRDAAKASKGKIKFLGRDIGDLAPWDRSRAGLVMVPEREKIFTDLTVFENLQVGVGRNNRRGSGDLREMALSVFPDLRNHLNRKGGYLSGGQRQMLALASALCMGPKLMIVDELTLGLSPAVIASMVTSLTKIASAGIPILAAEQSVAVALEFSNTIHVLESGRQVASGTKETLLAGDGILSTFLGSKWSGSFKGNAREQ